MRIKTRLRAKIHVYDALEVLIDDAIRQPGDWLDHDENGRELTVSEAAIVREVANDLRTEVLRRLDKAKAKIKPKNPDGHVFVSQSKCTCGFEVGDEPNGPCPFGAVKP